MPGSHSSPRSVPKHSRAELVLNPQLPPRELFQRTFARLQTYPMPPYAIWLTSWHVRTFYPGKAPTDHDALLPHADRYADGVENISTLPSPTASSAPGPSPTPRTLANPGRRHPKARFVFAQRPDDPVRNGATISVYFGPVLQYWIVTHSDWLLVRAHSAQAFSVASVRVAFPPALPDIQAHQNNLTCRSSPDLRAEQRIDRFARNSVHHVFGDVERNARRPARPRNRKRNRHAHVMVLVRRRTQAQHELLRSERGRRIGVEPDVIRSPDRSRQWRWW